MGSNLQNESLKWVFLVIWFGGNVAIFVVTFLRYFREERYFYTRLVLQNSLPIAKASGAALNLNSLLILLPVCRNLISFIRGSIICRFCKRNVRRMLDKNITFHKACAWVIVFWSIVHYFAHTFNFERYWRAYEWESDDNITTGLFSTLSLLPGTPNGTYFNPIRVTTSATNPMLELLKNLAGYTGLIISVPLLLIVSSATEFIRHSYFEVFWYTHHLFIVYFIGLVTHGLGYVVRQQTNLDVHDPEKCAPFYQYWGSDTPDGTRCDIPQFTGDGPASWKWALGPMVLYFIERLVRFARSYQDVTVTKVVNHPSRVIELQLQKKGFEMESGQYVFIKIPSISHLEWHPFTLTSCPQEPFFSVHVRLAGDWTTALAKAFRVDEAELARPEDMPRIAIDGPFGTCSEDAYQYQTDVFVAAGIGVTPFASILKDIWYRYRDPSTEMKLQKVHFYWLCPDTNAFEWFVDLLKTLEEQMREVGKQDFVEYNICLTRGWNRQQAENIALDEESEFDTITGLRRKTIFGRPNWDKEFSRIAENNVGKRTGVFFCGPKALSGALHKMSNKYSDNKTATHFVYNKENF